MADEPTAQNEDTPSESTETTQNEQARRRFWTFNRVVMIVVGSFLAIYVLLFLIAFVAALSNAQGAASFFGYFRDLITIAMSVSTLIIIVGIGILIVQIGRFVNLLRSEVKPITHDTRQAIQDVRSTTKFVQKQGLQPIMKSQSFVAGLLAFLREIVQISRILQRRNPDVGVSDE